jgi:hypothetical protein
LILTSSSDLIRAAFGKEKSCAGLHEVGWHDKDMFNWALSLTGDGRGTYEVMLEEVAGKHYVFLGTNTRKAVHKACDIIQGREQANWLALP